MANEITTSVGSKIYIGDPTWTADTLSEFDAQADGDWDEIGLVETIPEHGIKWSNGSFVPVGDGEVMKYKTTRDDGDMTLTCARKGSDAGQVAARAAAEDKRAYPFKVVLGDTPDGVGAKPTRSYFWALVNSATIIPGGATDVVKTSVVLAVTDGSTVVGETVAGT